MYKNDNDTHSSSPDVYSTEMLKELDKRSKNIRFAITRMDVDIEKASVNLYWIYSTKAYKAMGHESIIDYALAEFDIAKSTTYNYITLAERFGHCGEDGNLLFDGFDKKYKSYSSSKLNLLAPLTDEEIEDLDIKPEMSVRDIKKKIKSAKDGFEIVYLPPDRFKKPHEEDSTDKQHDNSKSITENGKKNDALEDNDDELRDDNVVAPEFPEKEPKTINNNNYCNISCYIDQIVNGEVVRSDLWGFINTRFIYDTLKYNPEKSLLIRSVKSDIYAFDREIKEERG